MKERKHEIIYSDPVQEIMGDPPRRIIRVGIPVFFLVFIMLLFFSWLIKYPDIVPSPVEITTLNPPVTLVTKITGRIKYLYVKEKEKVSSGQIVGVMETTASINEIELLKHALDTIKKPEFLRSGILPEFSNLGELQEYYASFLKNLSNLNIYKNNDFYGSKIKSVSDEIDRIKEYISRLIVKEKLYSENQKLEASKYARDSGLFSTRTISQSSLELSRQSLIRNNIELQQVRLEHSAKLIELSEKQQLLQDYKINRQEEGEKLVSILGESFLNLKARISIWENSYLLVSPIDGIATFTKFWSANQSVVKDEPVVNIVPLDTGNYVGRMNLKMLRSGKVEKGQMVHIKLSGYPYMEYGMVRGVVKSKSLVSAGDAYVIEIDLPNGLTTLYGRKLEFTQNMQGTAEIITRDVRLLQKIVNPFRYMVSKNKR